MPTLITAAIHLFRSIVSFFLETIGVKRAMKIEDYFCDPDIKLIQCLARKDKEQAQALLNNGLTINVYGKDNITPIVWFLIKKDTQAIELCMELGADINAPSIDSCTPLSIIAGGNDIRMVEFLLKNGADPNGTNENGDPLIFKVILNDNLKQLKLLADYRVQLNILNRAKQSPALYAAYLNSFDIVDYLMETGANPVQVDKNNIEIAELIQENIDDEVIIKGDKEYSWMMKVKQRLTEAGIK